MRRRELAGTLVASVVATVALVFWLTAREEVEQATVPAPRLEWQVGATQSYRLTIDSDVRLYLQEGSTRLVQSLAGELHLRVFERVGERIRVGFQLRPVHYLLGGARDEELEERLSIAIAVVFGVDGRPISFDFARGLPDAERMLLEEALRTFQFVLSEQPASTWTSVEEHASGRYVARYETRRDGWVSKHKTRYTDVAPQLQLFESGGTPELRLHRSLASFRPSHDTWLDAASVEERATVVQGGRTSIETSLRAELERIPRSRDVGLALFGGRSLDEVLRVALPAPRLAEGPAGPDAPAGGWSAASRRAYLEALLERWQQREGAIFAKLDELRSALRRDPALAAEVAALIRESPPTGELASVMIHALERAGTREAEEALLVLMDDPDVLASNRLRAIVSLGGVENPSDDAIGALFSRAREPGDPREVDLANTASLALGSIASALADSDPERADRLNDAIEDDLASRRDPGRVGMAIKAMSNSGDERFVETITPYLDDDSDYVRASAARALGRIGGNADTCKRLTERLAREQSPRVRLALSEGLSNLEVASVDSLRIVAERIGSESQVATRNQMAHYLGKNLSIYPAGASTLQRLAVADPSAEIRRYAASVLYAQSERQARREP